MKRHLLQLFFTVLFVSSGVLFSTNTLAQANAVPDDIEFQALKAIYDHLGGANWTNTSNWPTAGNWPATATATQMDAWYGITVTNGDITAINLSVNKLKGIIPSTIGNLTQLGNLYFQGNQLSGEIPATIGNLKKIGILNLSQNQLSGPIPPSLGSLPRLFYLLLQENKLSGSIPKELGLLADLDQLVLTNNKLKGPIPPELGSLFKLTLLNLGINELSGEIPSSFVNLTKLVSFYANNNKLSGTIPPLLNSLVKLNVLYLNNNNFSGSFPPVNNLTLLTILNVSNNYLSSIPSGLLNLTLLNSLNLSNNELTGIPDFTQHVNRLNLSLYLQNNRLDFSQLEPLVGGGIKTVGPLSQKTINDQPILNLAIGSPLVITARTTGSFSTVTWEKQSANGQFDPIGTDQDSNPQTYTRTPATTADEGIYRWKMTNTKVTGVTLYSDPIAVKTPARFVLDNWAFQYKYDGRKRMTHKKVPGADWVYMVYDDRDRLVLTQDGEQRKTNKWSFTKYDALNRPILTGIYTHNELQDQAQMSAKISTTNFYDTFDGSTPFHGYTNNVFPRTNANSTPLEVLTVTYYDRYDFKTLLSSASYAITEFDYKPSLMNPETRANGTYPQDTASNQVIGLVTGVRTRVLGQPTFLSTVNYYDDKYRLIQATSNGYRNNIVCTTSIYDFVGKVLATRSTNKEGQSEHSIYRKFEHDHAGRLLATYHGIDGATPILLAKNEYNELGQLIDKNLHSTDNGTTFKQSTDYRYNIRGWLTSINNAALTQGSNNEDDSNMDRDLFGMELAYEKPVATLTDENGVEYNGNISAIMYSNNLALGTIKSNGYKFDYDPMNRLKESNFRVKKTDWGLPEFIDEDENTLTAQSYSETGFDYDLNGNIKNLTRSGKGNTMMDVLTYDYGASNPAMQSNQLLGVKDNGETTQGFIDGNVVGNDYNYDVNGNMVTDKNKAIMTSTGGAGITYNHLNLPDKVLKSNGDYIRYIYDATGRKLSQQVYNASNVLKKRSDYVGEYFYENDTLKFINHEEGRIVMVSEGQPIAPEYQYHLKDHLGNVRTTFTTKEEVEETIATLESQYEYTERSEFIKYDDTRRVFDVLFDHTKGVKPSTTPGYSIRLNGSSNERNGIARSMSVMPGDKIDMQVFGKYIDPATPHPDQTAWNNLTAFALDVAAAAQTVVIDGLGYTSGTLRVPPYKGVLTDPDESALFPKAHLNWTIFDRDWKFLDGGAKQLKGGAENGTDVTFGEINKSIEIKEPGYVYIWLSNTSATEIDVYFDDFKVTHTKSPFIAINEYYAYGLSFNEYNRENSLLNQFKYNGKELQDELNVGWYDYQARQYDPALGRFLSIDPAANLMRRFSPYAYAFDNPIRFTDPDGMIPNSCCGFAGAFTRALTNPEVQRNAQETNEHASKVFDGRSGVSKSIGLGLGFGGQVGPALAEVAVTGVEVGASFDNGKLTVNGTVGEAKLDVNVQDTKLEGHISGLKGEVEISQDGVKTDGSVLDRGTSFEEGTSGLELTIEDTKIGGDIDVGKVGSVGGTLSLGEAYKTVEGVFKTIGSLGSALVQEVVKDTKSTPSNEQVKKGSGWFDF